ncbi:MAG: oligopeptide/dipeptide ABC transporter ATP-binding protein, partial [Nitrospinota bacterium]
IIQSPILKTANLKKHFVEGKGIITGGRTIYAVDGISFELARGETVGVVGESGCGKSTLAKTILKLTEPTAGRIIFKGEDITNLSSREMRPIRKDMQIIFQDPRSSLNPRMRVGDIIGEPLQVHKIGQKGEREEMVASLLKKVGLKPEQMMHYPHEFSGGERQRVAIARAIALNPAMIIGDEPVSALDVSIQAQILNLLMDLQEEYGLSYLIISHDLRVVKHICNRIIVLYLGRIVEMADTKTLYDSPSHPYTEALLSAIPSTDPFSGSKKIILKGDLPSPANPP